MPSVFLRIDALSPLAFSAGSATTGGHRALPFIPGAALLGLAAGALHGSGALDDWRAFHSGLVRFGDAFPLAGDRPAYPMPRALHAVKDAADGVLHNLVRAARTDGTQYAQRRDGFVAGSGAFVRVRMTGGLKTAVDEATGSARQAMLFQTNAIAAGQSFLAELSFDDEAQTEADAILAFLAPAAGATHRIGRSRSAEFGLARFTRVDGAPSDPSAPAGDFTVFWALSDLCLASAERGEFPSAAEFGLASGAFDPARSFLHFRRFAPFNGRWRKTAPERHVIGAGSVIVFSGATPGAGGRLSVGMETQSGFGAVWRDPELLAGESVVLTEARAGPLETAPEPTDLALFAYLKSRAAAKDRDLRSRTAAEQAFAILAAAWRTAAAYEADDAAWRFGPGRSQWRDVENAANAARDADDLRNRLFGTNGLARAEDDAWRQRIDAGKTYRKLLQEALAAFGDDARVRPVRAMGLLARKATAALEDMERQQGAERGR